MFCYSLEVKTVLYVGLFSERHMHHHSVEVPVASTALHCVISLFCHEDAVSSMMVLFYYTSGFHQRISHVCAKEYVLNCLRSSTSCT